MVYDPDPVKVTAFCRAFPQVRPVLNLEAILDDPAIRLVAAAAVPDRRGSLGCRVMRAGKDYSTAKAPFTSFGQLDAARTVVQQTFRKYMVYYSERLNSESAVAGQLVEHGAIGRVIQTIGTGPHRLSAASRPDWFFKKERYGGILCDIGSHQCDQFLFYTGAKAATLNFSVVANVNNPAHPEFEDFGEASFRADHGISGYFRVDWLTPAGLRSWGDGRTIILGTKGCIELRKNVEIAADNPEGEQLYLVDEKGEQRISCKGKVGHLFLAAYSRLFEPDGECNDSGPRLSSRRAQSPSPGCSGWRPALI